MPDFVRVLRIIEYVGERKEVEAVIAKSVHGTRDVGTGSCFVSATTLGEFPVGLDPDTALCAVLDSNQRLKAELARQVSANQSEPEPTWSEPKGTWLVCPDCKFRFDLGSFPPGSLPESIPGRCPNNSIHALALALVLRTDRKEFR